MPNRKPISKTKRVHSFKNEKRKVKTRKQRHAFKLLKLVKQVNCADKKWKDRQFPMKLYKNPPILVETTRKSLSVSPVPYSPRSNFLSPRVLVYIHTPCKFKQGNETQYNRHSLIDKYRSSILVPQGPSSRAT